MTAFPSLPLFTDAYIADTTHLTMEEHGAYLRLLMFAWRSKGCRLPNDDVKLARMLGISTARWLKLKPTVMDFWTLVGGFWSQRRLTKEHAFVTEKVKKRRAAGKLGGRPKSLIDNDEGKAKGSQEKSKPKAPNPTPTPTDSPVVPKGTDPEGFAEFWKAYPKRDGDNPRKPAVRAYAKVIRDGADPAAILKAVRAHAAELVAKGKAGTEFVPLATTWLNQGRFERFTGGAGDQPGGGALPDPTSRLAGITDDSWRERVRLWKSRGGHWPWQQITEPPNDPKTKVPAHILAEFGIVLGDASGRVTPLRRAG